MNAAEWWGTLDQCGFTVMRTLLSALWQSSIVFGAMGLLVWVLRGRRATVRHTLWVAALLVAPVLPLLTSLASRTGAPQAPVSVLPTYQERSALPPAALEDVTPLPPVGPVAAAPGVTEPEASAGEQPRASVLEYPWALLLVAYVAGVVFLLAWTALGRIRLRQWVVGAVPVLDERVRSAFAEAKERLGLRREFLTLESLQVPAPLTAGLLRPAVLLPKGLSDRLTDAELRAVALHESAHIRRRDPLILSLIPLVRAVLFFHPLVWLACRQVSRLSEQAADDAVLDATGEPIAYAKMLARLAEDLRRRSFTTELAAGILLSKGAFLRRVEAILSDRRDQIRKLSRLALLGTVAGALLSLALAAALPLGERGPTSPQQASDSPSGPGDPPSEEAPVLAQGEPETAEEVLARMAEARKGVRSAEYGIRRQTRYVLPVKASGDFDVMQAPVTGDVLVPAGTLTVHKERFLVSAEKYRYETSGPMARMMAGLAQGGLGPSKTTYVYDGDRGFKYLPDQGRVLVRTEDYLGLLITFGPLVEYHFGLQIGSRRFGLDDALQLAGKEERKGSWCYVLVDEVGPLRTSYYIDPERNWTLVRESTVVVRPEQQMIQINGRHIVFSFWEWDVEITHEKDESGVWRPATWTLQQFEGWGPDRELKSVDVSVVEKATLNASMPASTFVIDVPKGTVVYDQDRDIEYPATGPVGDVAAPSVSAGDQAPELVLEEGAGVTLAQFTGKPVVLAFVSIYSRPCVKVLDQLRALQEEKGADALGVIAVHDRTATPEEIEEFRKAPAIPFPIVRVPDAPRDGWDGHTFRAYGVTTVPTVVFIDGKGKVVSAGDLNGLLEGAARSLAGWKSDSPGSANAEVSAATEQDSDETELQMAAWTKKRAALEAHFAGVAETDKERQKKWDLDDAEVQKMSSYDLCAHFLETPCGVTFDIYDDPNIGVERVRRSFNVLKELLDRADAVEAIGQYYAEYPFEAAVESEERRTSTTPPYRCVTLLKFPPLFEKTRGREAHLLVALAEGDARIRRMIEKHGGASPFGLRSRLHAAELAEALWGQYDHDGYDKWRLQHGTSPVFLKSADGLAVYIDSLYRDIVRVLPKKDPSSSSTLSAARQGSAPTTEPSALKRFHLRGRVLLPDGSPAAGATVYLKSWDFRTKTWPIDEVRTTEADGSYDLGVQAFPVDTEGRTHSAFLYARLPGYGLWGAVLTFDEPVRQDQFTVYVEQEDVAHDLTLKPEATYRGTVVGPDDEPLAGVEVRLGYISLPSRRGHLEFLSEFQVTETDEAGTFEFADLPAGMVVVCYVKKEGYLGGRGIFRDSTEERFALALAGAVTGQVIYGDSGQPAANVALTMHSWTFPRSGENMMYDASAYATSDDEGKFTLSPLPECSGTVQLDRRYELDDWTAEMVFKVDVTPGQTTSGVVVKLIKGGLLKGRVIDAVTGEPVENASVGVVRSVASRQEHYGWGKTDEDGVYSLRLPPNQYDLRPGYAEGYVYDTSTTTPAERVTVEEGKETEAPLLKLTPGVDITVRVLTPEGKPASGVEVELRQRVRPYGNTQHTSATGETVYRGERPGSTVNLRARTDDGTLTSSAAFTPKLGEKNQVVLTLQRASPCTVVGRVVDEAGEPVAGALVYLFEPMGDGGSVGRRRATSGTDGQFEITAIDAGSDLYASAEAKGYGRKSSERFSLAPGETHDVGTWTLARTDQEVAGVVVDIDGEPVAGARVTARGVAKEGYANAETGNDGRFHLTNLPSDTIEVRAYLVQPETRILRQQARQMVPAGTMDVRLILGLRQKREEVPLSVGNDAPELVLEPGAQVTLAQFRGKPVVLAFVSIYSRPSVKVLDELKALQEEKGADALGAIAVHDRTATAEEIEQFRTDHGIPFPIVRVPDAPRDGWDGETFRAYGVTALPTVVVVDSARRVVSIRDGVALKDDASRLWPSGPSSEPLLQGGSPEHGSQARQVVRSDFTSAAVKAVRERWETARTLDAEIQIERFLPDGEGNRKPVGTDHVSVLWSGERWKIRWEDTSNRYDVRGYSGRRAWRLMVDSDSLIGFLYERDREPLPFGIANVSDPYQVSYLIYGKPLWAFREGPAPPAKDSSGAASSSTGLVFSFEERPPLLERVTLVRPTEAIARKFREYDMLLYEGSLCKLGIHLASDHRDAFQQLDVFDNTAALVGRMEVLERDAVSYLPLRWKYDSFSRQGEWTAGYVATVVSWRQPAEIDAQAFSPDFPNGTIIMDRDPGFAHDLNNLTDEAGKAGLEGRPAPQLVLEEGADITLAQFKGKPVVLAFVSIYSRPCVKVLDELKALQAENGEENLGVMAVHDRTATPEEVEQFRKDHATPFPIVRVPDAPRDGWDSATFRAYGVTALPAVVFIDIEGRILSITGGSGLGDELLAKAGEMFAAKRYDEAERAIEALLGLEPGNAHARAYLLGVQRARSREEFLARRPHVAIGAQTGSSMRIYDVRSLVGNDEKKAWGLIGAIVAETGEGLWDDSRQWAQARGTSIIYRDGNLIVVRPLEVHEEIQRLLEALRGSGLFSLRPLVERWRPYAEEMASARTGHDVWVSTWCALSAASLVPKAEVNVRQEPGQPPTIEVELTSAEADHLLRWTKAHLGEQVAVIADGEVWSVATVKEAVSDGKLLLVAPDAERAHRFAQKLQQYFRIRLEEEEPSRPHEGSELIERRYDLTGIKWLVPTEARGQQPAVDLVRAFVGGAAWQRGRIEQQGATLVVVNTDDVHTQVANILEGLKKHKDVSVVLELTVMAADPAWRKQFPALAPGGFVRPSKTGAELSFLRPEELRPQKLPAVPRPETLEQLPTLADLAKLKSWEGARTISAPRITLLNGQRGYVATVSSRNVVLPPTKEGEEPEVVTLETGLAFEACPVVMECQDMQGVWMWVRAEYTVPGEHEVSGQGTGVQKAATATTVNFVETVLPMPDGWTFRLSLGLLPRGELGPDEEGQRELLIFGTVKVKPLEPGSPSEMPALWQSNPQEL